MFIFVSGKYDSHQNKEFPLVDELWYGKTFHPIPKKYSELPRC